LAVGPEVLVAQLAGLPAPEPLVLVPRRQARHLNSQLAFLAEGPEVLLHPDDATAAGVSDGKPVLVHTDHGELSGVARVTDSIRRGAVSVPHGYADANVNLLTDHTDIDPLTGMTRYSGVPVSIKAAQ